MLRGWVLKKAQTDQKGTTKHRESYRSYLLQTSAGLLIGSENMNTDFEEVATL